MHDVPLLSHPLNEPTAFTPETLIDTVRTQRGLPLEPPPRVCVLDFDGDLTDWLVARELAHPWNSWPCFHTTLFSVEIEGETCGVIPRTIGGPYAVLVAEQLAAAGAKAVVGLTSAGRVLGTLPIPSIVIATSAVRDEGTSYHYLPPGERVDAPAELPVFLENELTKLASPVRPGPVWTTDAPYRETQQQLEAHAVAGVLAVEMQAASLFAFAASRKFPLAVVAQVSNAVDHSGDAFDKGSELESVRLLHAISRAGYRFLQGR